MARRKGGSVFLWAMLALLAVGLVGFGTGNVGGGGRTALIGTAGGLPIAAQDYAGALTRQIRAVGDQLGQPLTAEQARELGLDRQVLAGLVSARVLDGETARLGLSVGDARVAEAVRAETAFQGLSGGFDRDAYREALRRAGLTEARYEDGLREDTARAMLQAAVVGGVPEPEALAAAVAEWGGERRVVTWAELPAEAEAASLPTPEALQAWYDAHPEAYTAPEVRQVAYAWVTPEMIQGAQAMDEAEVRALYDERLDEFVKEERRLVERLVFPDQAAAEAARARLDSGEAGFEALVEERGLALSDIDLGDVGRADLGEAAEPVFAAQPGDVVGPVPTDLGPALLRVNAILAADETPFEEAAPALRAEIASEAARRAISEEVGRIEDLAAGGATVEDLAGQTLLEPGTLAWSEGVTEGPAAYAPFRAAVAAAEEDGFPEVIDLEDGGLAVLRLDGVTPPSLRPFEEVAAEVEADWRADALAAATGAEAERRAEAIAGGATFEEQGLTPRTEGPRTRRDVIEGAPEGTVAAAFALEPGATDVIATPPGAVSAGGAVVLRLDAVELAPEGDPGVEAEQEALARQLSGAIAQDLFAAFSDRLQADAEVRLDDAAIQAVNEQIQ